jgi:hypothetical protein
MDALRRLKSVRRVTALEPNAANGVTPVEIYCRGGKKRKTSRINRPLDRAIRRLADVQGTAASTYLARHEKSSRKRRDGWIRDLNLNLARAHRKGLKRLRVRRWLDL